MATVQRKQAPRLPLPAARYWKGKAPKGAVETQSDSDADEPAQDGLEQTEGVLIEEAGDVDMSQGGSEDEDEDEGGIQLQSAAARVSGPQGRSMNIALKDVSVSKEGKVIVAGRLESGKTELEGEESSGEEEPSEEEVLDEKVESEEESSEYESSTEETSKPLFRPVFIPKRARATIAEKGDLAQNSENALRKQEQEAEERRKQSHDMVAESIRRELAEKEKEDQIPDVDDTDGLDPDGEFEAWRLRELSRIKEEKEEELRREEEREELERRRALPEEQRFKEDLERAEKSRADKPKGQQKFLQKYWHKGAYHQDEEILRKRDYTKATLSTIDVTSLPKVMQVKNFGKRSRTKYTHLLDQDTTAGNGGFGGTAPVKRGGTGTDMGKCFVCGGPHLKIDCPQNGERSGANAIATGVRPRISDSQDGRTRDVRTQYEYQKGRDSGYGKRNDDMRWRDERHGKDGRSERSWQRGDRRDNRDYRPSSRSRSRSSARQDNYRRERRLSRERSVDDGYREKRRRLD